MLLADAINHRVKSNEEPLIQADGIICSKCNAIFRKTPLIGKCTTCGGELVFYSGENKSRCLSF
jgi:hypothetical protein